MSDPLLLFIARGGACSRFVVKGVIGFRPTVSMGLLAVTMQPSARRSAIVIVPAVVPTIWQTLCRPVFARHQHAAGAAAGGYGDWNLADAAC